MNDEKINFTWGLAQELLNQLGYIQVTRFMLDAYAELGLTRNEFLCLIHLASFHYNSPRGQSRPSAASIAKKMGYAHPNSILLLANSLEQKGMLIISRSPGKPSTYDASPFAQAAFNLLKDPHSPLWGSDGTPTTHCGTPPQPIVYEEKEKAKESEQEKKISPTDEKPDPLLLSLDRKTVKNKESNYAVPPPAGGADPFTDGPLDAFAIYVAGIIPGQLPAKTRRSWAGKLHQIAKQWSTEENPITAEIMERAIRSVPDSDIGWKTYTSPFAGNFETDIGPLLLGGGQTKQGMRRAGPDLDKFARARAMTLERIAQHGNR